MVHAVNCISRKHYLLQVPYQKREYEHAMFVFFWLLNYGIFMFAFDFCLVIFLVLPSMTTNLPSKSFPYFVKFQ